MTYLENILSGKMPRPKHGLFLINTPNINPTIFSLILITNLIKTTTESSGKILLKDTVGTLSKSNKRIDFLKSDLLECKNQFSSLDKYTFMNANFNKEYWKKIDKDYPNISTIVITDITPLTINKNTQYTDIEKEEKYQKVLREMRLYAEQKNKFIIIIESKKKSESNISPYIFKENIYDFFIEDNKMILFDNKENIFPLSVNALTNNDTKQPIDIKKKISTIKRINFDNVAKSTLRTLPLCKSGFHALDKKLNGGFELGQVVSIVSSDNDILTQFSLQMSTQLPNFYNPLYICLTMNLRRLKDMLSHKNTIQKNNGFLNNNQDNIHLLTNDKLDKDGDIEEILEAIEYYHQNEDTRIVFIDSDDMLYIEEGSFSDSRREVDVVYKKLQILANKLDILIMIHSELTQEILNKVAQYYDSGLKSTAPTVPIDNSIKAIKYVKTQLHIEESDIRVTKSLKRVSGDSGMNNLTYNGKVQVKELGNFIDIEVE